MEELITLRVSFLIDRVLEGMKLQLNEATDLLINKNTDLSLKEVRKRSVLIAAIINLVDFAAHQQITLINNLPDERFVDGSDQHLTVIKRYNETFAMQENAQVLYAASVAAWWIGIDDNTILTYMTQSDERVRAWHLSLEGVSYPKKDFPTELIPPIEWGCRCFLIGNGVDSVRASLPPNDFVKSINPVFRESLAKGGRIFSEAHPYFKTEISDEVKAIMRTIKSKFGI